jgi:4-amino-4-deoxy-L-arabinose transferase-like glycosyltransferase
LWAGWVVNLLFSILSLFLIFALSRNYYGRFVGWAAVVLMAVLPQAVSYTAIMASEIPAIVMMMMVFWLLTKPDRDCEHWMNQVGVGFVIFLATIIRSTNLLMLPFLLLIKIKPLGSPFSWKQIQHALRRLVPLLTTVVLLLGSWVFHQYLLTGKAKLFFGEEIWMLYATNYEHNGSMFEPMPFKDDIQKVDDGSLAGRLRSYQVMQDKSWGIIQSDPLKYLQFGFVRLKGILWDSRTGVQWSIDHSKTMKKTIIQQPKILRHLTEYSTQFWRVILVLASFGFIFLMSTVWREQDLEKKRVATAILVFLILWLVMHYSIAVATDRYQFQILPWVILLASISLEKLNTGVQKLIAKPRII